MKRLISMVLCFLLTLSTASALGVTVSAEQTASAAGGLNADEGALLSGKDAPAEAEEYTSPGETFLKTGVNPRGGVAPCDPKEERVKDIAPVGADDTVNADNCVQILQDLGVDIDSFRQVLEEGISQGKDSIDLTSFEIPNEKASAVKYYAQKTFPDYFEFALTGSCYFSYTSVSDKQVISNYSFSYRERANTPEKLRAVMADVAAAENALLGGILENNTLTDVEKALLVHDRLAAHVYYDEDTYYYVCPAADPYHRDTSVYVYDGDSYTAYGALVKGKAVCSGYADAYEYLMNKVGVKTISIDGSQMDHGWDIVFIDNKPYFVDVTWDDYDYGMIHRVEHDNFLRSAQGFADTGHIIADNESYIDGVPIDSAIYDEYYWQDSTAEFQLADNQIYYLNNEAGTFNKADGNHTVLYAIPEDEKSNNDSLCGIGNDLLLSYSGSVFRFDPATDTLNPTPLASLSELGIDRLWGTSVGLTSGSCTWEWEDETLTIGGSGDLGERFRFDQTSVFGYYGCLQTPLSNLIRSVSIADGVTNIGTTTFWFCGGLASVTIGSGVKNIDERAFYDCENLTSVTIGSSVESIGKDAFAFCKSLKSVNIPDSVTSIGKTAFYYCESMTDVTIGSSVESIGKNAFTWCKNLTGVVIPDSVTSLGEAVFYCCGSLANAAVGNGVKEILKETFYNCQNLTEVTLGSGLESIGAYAFFDCESLNSINIPDGLTSIGTYAFYYCENLTSITIPDGVTSIGAYAFCYCENLNNVVIPDSVTSIGEKAFYYCINMTGVAVGNSVTSIGKEAFASCNLNSITVPDSVTEIGEKALGYCYGDKISLFTIRGHEGTEAERYAKDNDFFFRSSDEYVEWQLSGPELTISGNGDMDDYDSWTYPAPWGKSITKATIESGVKSIGAYAFYNCRDMTSVTIPNSVTTIKEYAFFFCSSLTGVTIPDSVTTIGECAFYNCKDLTSVTVPESVTSIGEEALGYYNGDPISDFIIRGYEGTEAERYAKANGFTFRNVGEHIEWKLSGTSLTISGNGVMDDYDEWSNAAPWGTGITKVTIENGVKSIGANAFNGCENLKSITIPNSVTSIGIDAFYDCGSLTSVVIPNSVKSIGNSAFLWCSSLTSVTFGTGVTSIGKEAFESCGLKSVTIPKNVTSIGKEAFGYQSGEKNKNFIVRGIAGTAAERYAKENGFTFRSSDEYVNWKLSGTELTISGNGDMDDYNDWDSTIPWGTGITKVTIKNGVKSIGACAFSYCFNLKSVVIADSVTKIGEYAFQNCRKLSSVTMGSGLTTVGKGAFCGCAMSSMSIPDGVKSIGAKAFGYDSQGNRLGGFALLSGKGTAAQSYANTNGLTFVIRTSTPKLGSIANTASGVKLSWSKTTNAVKYRVYRKAGSASNWSSIGVTTAVSYLDKTAKSGTKYTYTVRCISKDGKVYASGYDKTGKSILYLAQPKITKFENIAGGMKLTWSKSTGAVSYKVFIKSGKTWKTLAAVKTNVYTYTKVKSGSTYTFTVRAVSKAVKTLSAYHTTGWKQKFIAAPALPTLKNTKSGVQITFKKVTGAEKYRIFRKVGSGKFAKLADTTSLKFVDKTAKNGKTYTYTVRCISKNGKTYTSAYNTKGRAIKCKR